MTFYIFQKRHKIFSVQKILKSTLKVLKNLCAQQRSRSLDYFSLSDLKAIRHSKRANLYYLEHCLVMKKNRRVLYLQQKKQRLVVGRALQQTGMKYSAHICQKDRELKADGFNTDDLGLQQALANFSRKIELTNNVLEILVTEAQLTKALYRYATNNTEQNDFLNHGNYLAYGKASSTLWVLCIPQDFVVMHGKPRCGAQVFDIADLIKDAIVLPLALVCAKNNAAGQQFRRQCLQASTDHKASDYMFNSVEVFALCGSQEEEIVE